MTKARNWLKWKFVNFCLEYDFPGDGTPIVRGSALKALEGVRRVGSEIIELAGFTDSCIPGTGRAIDSRSLRRSKIILRISVVVPLLPVV